MLFLVVGFSEQLTVNLAEWELAKATYLGKVVLPLDAKVSVPGRLLLLFLPEFLRLLL